MSAAASGWIGPSGDARRLGRRLNLVQMRRGAEDNGLVDERGRSQDVAVQVIPSQSLTNRRDQITVPLAASTHDVPSDPKSQFELKPGGNNGVAPRMQF